ncbi:MAG: DUF2007 domain-containing protein [Anaerosomatales bacterium]|nr:DUF2007 domain-containing protein [Anaerosomatales bacterium]
MYCPQCRSEYVSGIAECPECGVALAEALPEPTRQQAESEPVVVFATGRSDLIALAKSILMSAGIEFSVRNEEVQDLFGYGRFPGGSSILMGPIEISVAEEHASDARALLAGLEPSGASESDADAGGAYDTPEPGSVWSRLRALGKIAATVIVCLFFLELVWGLVSTAVGW